MKDGNVGIWNGICFPSRDECGLKMRTDGSGKRNVNTEDGMDKQKPSFQAEWGNRARSIRTWKQKPNFQPEGGNRTRFIRTWGPAFSPKRETTCDASMPRLWWVGQQTLLGTKEGGVFCGVGFIVSYVAGCFAGCLARPSELR